MHSGMIFFVILFFALYGLVHFYIGMMAWKVFGNFFPHPWVYWVTFTALGLSLVLGRTSKSFLPRSASKPLDLIGSYWMATIVYLLLTFLIILIIRLFNKWLHFFPKQFRGNYHFTLYLGLTVLVIIGGTIIYGAWNAHKISVSKYEVHIPKKAATMKSLNIVMVSDIHLGEINERPRLDRMVNKINALKPDIILIGGDIIDSELEPFKEQHMEKSFANLISKYGVYACLGNHDYFSGSLDEKLKYFKSGGIHVLRDTSEKIANSFYIAGREDASGVKSIGTTRKSVQQLVQDLDATLPIILLDHQPLKLGDAEKAGIDLQFSGHTHHGQFFPMQYINRLEFEIEYGYLKKGNLNVIVTSGFGTWGPPIRLGSLPEIVQVTATFD